MSETKIKITELPSSGTDTTGLYTIGVDRQGRSVQVPLGDILSAMQRRGIITDLYFTTHQNDPNVPSELVIHFKANDGTNQVVRTTLPSAESAQDNHLGCISHQDWLKIQAAVSDTSFENFRNNVNSELHTLRQRGRILDVNVENGNLTIRFNTNANPTEGTNDNVQEVTIPAAALADTAAGLISHDDWQKIQDAATQTGLTALSGTVQSAISTLKQRGKIISGWFHDSQLHIRFNTNADPTEGTNDNVQEVAINLPAAASAEGSTLGCISHDDWVKIQDLNWYGVEWSTDNSNPACTRIGNMEMHRTLPIQSKMRGCLLNDDGEVVEYLPANQWPASLTDGSRGQVMVEIPRHYRRFETHGDIRRVKLSEMPLPGFHEVPTCYVSAYQATCQRSTHKLSSVRNFNEDYMGGNINSTTIAAYNGTPLTRCGRPICSGYRADVRRYARNRGAEGEAHWNIYTYDIHKTITWLFVVEYATRQSQAAYNPELTADGFRQGGLGVGAAFGDSEWWGGDINNLVPGKIGYQSFIPCGVSDTLGNHSGEVAYDVPDINGDVVGKMRVARYRGIEHPWGHLNIILDDVNVLCASSTGGDIFTPTGEATIYITDQPIHFANANYSQYRHHTSAVPSTISDSGGIVTKMAFGDNGEIIAEAVGGNSSAHYCDRFTGLRLDALTYANNSADHMMTQGGSTLSAGNGGIFALSIATNNTYADGAIGTRLTYIP